ncbi:MAG: TetR/AcrR family transcriptional regulator [Acidimicrobiales bacterium]
MPTETELAAPMDGRTARAVRTKDAIVEACLALIDEGDLRPTGPRIAERAGVSVRSIFQHFDDLDALFGAVGEKVAQRLAGLIAHIDPTGPLEERIDAFVLQRTEVLEAVTPVLRAALVYAASSEEIRRQFDDGHRFFGDQVDQTFAPELAAAPEPDRLRDALVVASSWPAWDLLRGPEGRSVEEARASVAKLVRAALEAPAKG